MEPRKFSEWLEHYEDKKVIQYLKYGWPLNATEPTIDTSIPKNQAGARDNPEQIRNYLKKEIEAGSVIGPFKKNPFGKIARFLPLDTRPKKDSQELRVILNLSYPFQGDSVNKSINGEIYAETDNMKLSYPTVDDLCKIIRSKKGKKTRIFIRDLSKAYRQLWMCPGSIQWLGYWFEDSLFFDVTLSMGSKSAAYCCQRTTDAITYVFGTYGYQDVNYLDDLGAAEEDEKVDEAYDCLGWILSTISIKESKHKATPPAFIAVFLGILFNTITMSLQITEDRLVEIKGILNSWTHKKSATLRELQSLLGKLNFASSTVRSGRVFVSRLINALKEYPHNGRKKISKEMKKDIEWWLIFMEKFDGITIMPPCKWSAPDTILSLDACLKSCGGWSGDEAFHKEFPSWLTQRSDIFINELELITIIVALKTWTYKIRNKNILAYCDNEVSCKVVNAGRANNRFSQACLREICFIMASNNAVLKLVHVAAEKNRISDCLSRWSEPCKREQFRVLTNHRQIKFVNVKDNLFRFCTTGNQHYIFLISEAQLALLQRDAKKSLRRAYAAGTYDNLLTQWVTFLQFASASDCYLSPLQP